MPSCPSTVRKGLETLERFLGRAHYHVSAYERMYLLTAELAEPRTGTNVTRPFPRERWGLGMRLLFGTGIS